MNKIRGLMLAMSFGIGCSPAFAKTTVITKGQNGESVTTITQDPTERDVQVLANKEAINILTIRKKAFHEDSLRSQRDEADADKQIQDLVQQNIDLEATK